MTKLDSFILYETVEQQLIKLNTLKSGELMS